MTHWKPNATIKTTKALLCIKIVNVKILSNCSQFLKNFQLIFISGDLTCALSPTGGHLNPAYSLSLCVLGRFPWWKLPIYVIIQVVGSFAGAAAAFALYYGKTKSHLLSLLCRLLCYWRTGPLYCYCFFLLSVRCHPELHRWQPDRVRTTRDGLHIFLIPRLLPEHRQRFSRPGDTMVQFHPPMIIWFSFWLFSLSADR